MASAQRVTVYESLKSAFVELETSVHQSLPGFEFVKQRLLRKLIDQKNVDQRYSLLARFYSICRDFAEYEECVKNLRGNKFPELAALVEYDNAVTNGYGVKAVEYFKEILRLNAATSYVLTFQGLFLIGQFPLLGEAFNQVKEKYQIQDPELQMQEFLRGVEVAKHLGLREERMAKMYDVFGEVMRAENLRWQTKNPNVKIFEADQGGPSILLQYSIHKNAVFTADLNKRIALAIAENNLATPGISIRVKPEVKMTEEEQQAVLAEV